MVAGRYRLLLPVVRRRRDDHRRDGHDPCSRGRRRSTDQRRGDRHAGRLHLCRQDQRAHGGGREGTLAPAPKPKITGVKQVGKKLTAVPGIWGPGAVALSYQWYAAGHKIPGANGKKLKLKSAQVGKRITVKVTGTKAGYTKVTKASKPTVQILP